MDHKGRIKTIQRSLEQDRLDALLVTHLPNIRYLCGFTGSAAALLLTESKALFFTDGRYTGQAHEEVQGARIVIAPKAALATAAAWIKAHSKAVRRTLGIEAEHFSVAARDRLAATLPSGVRLRSAPSRIETARMTKDAEELMFIRNAVAVGAGLFDEAVKTIRPGVPEVEIAARMEFAAHQAGAEGMSFPTIIAAGERSALPHGRASKAPIPGRGFVVCDFGVILAGYCSDQTRTVHVGRPEKSSIRMYEAVKRAQQAAIEAVGSGLSVGEVDRAARNLLKKEGFDRYFTHSTGHGVGLEIHEAPRVAKGQREVLKPGMVITVEPGVYIPGEGGVRIEDMVVVTEKGCEVLTPTGKELITL